MFLQRLLLHLKNRQGNAALVIGVFFFVVVTINLLVHAFYEGHDFGEILWLCNIIGLYLAYGYIMQSPAPINSALILAVPAQFLWIVDFFLFVFGIGMGRTEWLFDDSYLLLTKIISILLHAVTIPFAIYGTYKFGFDKKCIYWILPILIFLLPITYFFSSQYDNRNCVFYPCDMNFIQDYSIIISGEYMTVGYMIHEMIFWMIMCAISFTAVIYAVRKSGIAILAKTKMTSLSLRQ